MHTHKSTIFDTLSLLVESLGISLKSLLNTHGLAYAGCTFHLKKIINKKAYLQIFTQKSSFLSPGKVSMLEAV